MTLRFTPDTMAHVYDFLSHTAPFDRWNMPPSDEVVFAVTKSAVNAGDYYQNTSGRHVIRASARSIGHTLRLVELMAHEMIHLYQRQTKMDTAGVQHNAAYHKLAAKVCKYHGFDPRAFA
jgi:hypothetical protein